VVRAGYGVYYDQSSLATGEGLYFNTPYFDFKLFFPLGAQFPLSLSDPFPAFFPVGVPSSALALQRNLRTAYTQQWNFNVQRELGRDRVVELAYGGSKGTKLLGARDLNQPNPSPQPNNPRPMPQFADINILESRGDSSYQSLQARFQQSFQHGLAALASYTWPKSIDDASNLGEEVDPFHLRASRALSSWDIPHNVVVSYTYALPFDQLFRKNRLTEGCSLSGSSRFASGFPVTLYDDSDRSLLGTLGNGVNNNLLDTPKLLPGAIDIHTNPRNGQPVFNTGILQPEMLGQLGNSPRRFFHGPGIENFDMQLTKTINFRESKSLDLRVEAFNVFNHAQFYGPASVDGEVNDPNFGKVVSAAAPRVMQLAAKFHF